MIPRLVATDCGTYKSNSRSGCSRCSVPLSTELHWSPKVSEPSKTGPSTEKMDEAMKYIFAYLDEHLEESQFSLNELIAVSKCTHKPSVKTVKVHLMKKYGDGVGTFLRK